MDEVRSLLYRNIKIMKKFRVVITALFIFCSLIIIMLIALFDNLIFIRAANLVKDYVLPAGIIAHRDRGGCVELGSAST